MGRWMLEGFLWRLFKCAALILHSLLLLLWVSCEGEDLDRNGCSSAEARIREALRKALKILVRDDDHHAAERTLHMQQIIRICRHHRFLRSIEPSFKRIHQSSIVDYLYSITPIDTPSRVPAPLY